MRLCLVLKYPNTRVMFRNMTKQDFLDWWAFDQIEPIGGMRTDYQAASQCATMMNGFAALARSRKRFKIKDFLLEWGKEPEAGEPGADDGKTPWQQMKLVARMWAASSNVPDRKPGRTRPANKAVADKVAEAKAALAANDRRRKR